MILLELAAQGVKGVAPATGRLTLRPGYNVLASAEGAALARLVASLIAPGERDGETLPRVAGAPGGGALRAGATFAGKDRLTFRLVRDFAQGAQLQRYDAAQRTFVPLARELAEISRHLVAAGAPARARFDCLRVLDPADLPSRAPGAGLARAAPAAPARRALGPAEAEARLLELRDELERARAADRLQLELDGLQTRQFQQEKLLEDGGRLRQAAERALSTRAELDKQAAVLVPAFVAGLGVGVVALAGGVAGALAGSSWRYLALCDVPAFGVAAGAALRAIGDLEAGERIGRRRLQLDERERKAEEGYRREGTQLDAALAALELKSPTGLREAAQRVADAERALAAARAELGEWEARPEIRGAVDEKARLAAELARVEQSIAAEAGGYLRDPRTVEAEMARVQAEQAQPPAPEREAAPAAPARPSDPLAAFLKEASAAAGEEPAALLRAVGGRAGQLAGALSGGRLGAVLLDERGNLTAQAAGRLAMASSLAPADRDLLFIALKLAAAERELRGQLLLVGDVFAQLPLPTRRAAAGLLKQLARLGQILHATSDPVFREAADHAA